MKAIAGESIETQFYFLGNMNYMYFHDIASPSISQTAEQDLDYNIRGQRFIQNELSSKYHKIYST